MIGYMRGRTENFGFNGIYDPFPTENPAVATFSAHMRQIRTDTEVVFQEFAKLDMLKTRKPEYLAFTTQRIVTANLTIGKDEWLRLVSRPWRSIVSWRVEYLPLDGELVGGTVRFMLRTKEEIDFMFSDETNLSALLKFISQSMQIS